jgi:hypothetical protein
LRWAAGIGTRIGASSANTANGGAGRTLTIQRFPPHSGAAPIGVTAGGPVVVATVECFEITA